MIPQGLITQIAMIILAIGIVFTYVKPMFEQVTVSQDKIAQYRTEKEKVADVNAKLNQLLSKAGELTEEQRTQLYDYIPSTVDGVAVQRDLLFIAEEARIILTGLTYGSKEVKKSASVTYVEDGSEIDGEPVGRSVLTPHTFSLSFTTNYDELKNFLSLLEQNKYPLSVVNLKVASAADPGTTSSVPGATGATRTGELVVDLEVETYEMKMVDQEEN